MLEKLISWHSIKHHSYQGDNIPSSDSMHFLVQLCQNIILPLEAEFGPVVITYGFTSHSLLRYILKHSPGDMAPNLDQHAAMERNSKGNRICIRDGAACDFFIDGYENKMNEVAQYITRHLPFDRLYFYGKDSPIHISVSTENSRYALIREANSDGIRVNRKSAQGIATRRLFNTL